MKTFTLTAAADKELHFFLRKNLADPVDYKGRLVVTNKSNVVTTYDDPAVFYDSGADIYIPASYVNSTNLPATFVFKASRDNSAYEDLATGSVTLQSTVETQKGAPNGLAPLGSDSLIPDANLPARLSDATLADSLLLARLERQTALQVQKYNLQVRARNDDATAITETWANTTAWTGTGTVASGRVYSSAGLTRATPTSTRWIVRTTLHATGTTGKFSYVGVGSSSAAGDLVGIGQGSASTAAAILRGTNISAGSLTIPRTLPTLTAGDYLCTIVKDETNVSFTIQAVAGGQSVWGARVPVASFPGGVVNTIFMSANDTTAGGQNFGPVIIYPETSIPPSANWTVGGVALFGANKPLSIYRAESGVGHIISIPGDMDRRVPAPVLLFLHQSITGLATAPWTEARMANVTSALETGGYIIVSSDNGTGITAGGTQDKFGNQAGQDDYAVLVSWVRTHFATGALFLLGPSMGSWFVQNILASRKVGGISAVATISPGFDAIVMETNPSFQSLVRTAYSASSSADFATKVVGYNPMANPGWKFRGVPQKAYVGSNDTTAVSAQQITPFRAKVLPYVPEFTVVTLAVDHLDSTLYQGSNLVAFYDTYR